MRHTASRAQCGALRRGQPCGIRPRDAQPGLDHRKTSGSPGLTGILQSKWQTLFKSVTVVTDKEGLETREDPGLGPRQKNKDIRGKTGKIPGKYLFLNGIVPGFISWFQELFCGFLWFCTMYHEGTLLRTVWELSLLSVCFC